MNITTKPLPIRGIVDINPILGMVLNFTRYVFLNSSSSRSPLSTVVEVVAAISYFHLTHVLFPSLFISPVCSYACTLEEEIILATLHCFSLWKNLAAIPPEPLFHGIAVGTLGKTGLFLESVEVGVEDCAFGLIGCTRAGPALGQ